jgi:hypothetical protein
MACELGLSDSRGKRCEGPACEEKILAIQARYCLKSLAVEQIGLLIKINHHATTVLPIIVQIHAQVKTKIQTPAT